MPLEESLRRPQASARLQQLLRQQVCLVEAVEAPLGEVGEAQAPLGEVGQVVEERAPLVLRLPLVSPSPPTYPTPSSLPYLAFDAFHYP